MYRNHTIAIILPAKNEESALPAVIKDIPTEIDRIIIVDNGSTDKTSSVAKKLGAEVVREPKKGYGIACLAGLAILQNNPPDIVAFADADGSDDLSRLNALLDILIKDNEDLVIEQRIALDTQALSRQQRFGNWLATKLIYMLWHFRYNDLGPMRVIKWEPLNQLNMQDKNYGWTIEMQIRALKSGLRVKEHPLPYKKRIAGQSKISRTMSGTLKAGIKIIWTIFREFLRRDKAYCATRSF